MISEPFAKILAAGRSLFNQRAQEARRRFSALDMNAFAQFLASDVDIVVGAAAQAAPERLPVVVLAAYDLALELVGQSLAGPQARSTLVARVWRDLAPRYALLITRQPREVLGTLSNAALYLETVSGARTAQWVDDMAAIAEHVESLAELKSVGQVLAWRAGAAHFRKGAIEAAGQLPEALALRAFGGGASWSALRASLLADPWYRADPAGREVGSFAGFGGEFALPPSVRACHDGFIVKCAERYFLLVADACGSVLHPATHDEFHGADGQADTSFAYDGATLRVGARTVALDLPVSQLAVVCNEHTIAVTSPYTHAIRLLPLR